MFLRCGQFRGRGHGGNDRDRVTIQQHIERQCSALAIEYGHCHRPMAPGRYDRNQFTWPFMRGVTVEKCAEPKQFCSISVKIEADPEKSS